MLVRLLHAAYDGRGVAALVLLGLAACADGPQPSQTVASDSSGVRVVRNFAPDTPLNWRFVPAFTLGGAESGPEAFYTVRESTVGVDAAGRIYVLDPDGHRVIVFTADGDPVRTMGREGEGPGELSWPLALAVKPDGTVLIEDIGRGTVHGFDPDGLPLDTGEELVPNNRRIWGGRGYYAAISTLEEDHMLYRFLRVVGTDTTELARLTAPATGVVTLESCGMSLSGMSLLFSENIVWDAWRDRAVARSGAAYEVDVFSDGTQVARYGRAIEPSEATRDLAKRELGDGMRVATSAGVRECSVDEVIERRGYADRVPAIRAVRMGPDGRIWVSRGGPRPEPTPTDILAADGTYLGTLPADAPYPIGFLPDGRVLSTERDELDVVRLVAYRIEEGPAE